MRQSKRFLAFCSLLAVLSGAPLGQALGASNQPEILSRVGIEQKLGDLVSLDLMFLDEQGSPVRLRDYFGEKPVVLALVYYECPMLCTLVLNGLTRTLRAMTFAPGQEFELVALSIDHDETPDLAAGKKDEYLKMYGRQETAGGWHFLTGKEPEILTLADQVGFGFQYDPARDEYAHASAIMVLTPEGRVSRYFYGIEFSPRDLRLGLVEASSGEVGSPVDQLLLYCYHYDPMTGQYGVAIINVLRLSGLATVLAMGAFIWIMLRRDRSKKAALGVPQQ